VQEAKFLMEMLCDLLKGRVVSVSKIKYDAQILECFHNSWGCVISKEHLLRILIPPPVLVYREGVEIVVHRFLLTPFNFACPEFGHCNIQTKDNGEG
jgi:hypothetical protein